MAEKKRIVSVSVSACTVSSYIKEDASIYVVDVSADYGDGMFEIRRGNGGYEIYVHTSELAAIMDAIKMMTKGN